MDKSTPFPQSDHPPMVTADLENDDNPLATRDEFTWENDNDPTNPKNWPRWRKIMTISLVSAIGFSTPFAADVSAPAIGDISEFFHNTNGSLAGFTVSIFVLGNAIGPIVFAPASELWGRSPMLHITNVLFVAFSVGSALADSFWLLLLMRFFAGCAGAAPLAIGGGTIADLIDREKRGLYVGIFAIGGQLGPIIGPIVGAFLTEWPGWRWTFWIGAIVHAVVTLLCLCLLRETYAPAILARKRGRARKASRETVVLQNNVPRGIESETFRRAILRPVRILIKSPIVLCLSLFQACVFGYRYVMYTTITMIFEDQYHFSVPDTGLTYFGSGIGASIALWIITRACDQVVVSRKQRSAGAQPPPEIRLLPMIWSAPLCGIGLLWYGWAAQERVHWIVPIVGSAVFGAGIVGASLPSNLYIIDAFTEFAASGLSASFFLRFIFGGVLPLAGTPLYDTLGVGLGCTILGLIALFLCVFPPLIYTFGERLRIKYPLAL